MLETFQDQYFMRSWDVQLRTAPGQICTHESRGILQPNTGEVRQF